MIAAQALQQPNSVTIDALATARNPVLMFANGYGDHYLNLPAIRALARFYQGRLTLVGIDPAIMDIARGLPLARVVALPMQHTPTGRLFDVHNALEEIGQCDAFLSLNPWMNEPLQQLITGLGPKVSVGFFEPFDIRLQRDYSKHSCDLAFDMVHLLRPDWSPEQFAQAPTYARSDVELAERIHAALPSECKVLCIHPDTLPEKMWPEHCWVEMIDQLLDRYSDCRVVIVGLRGIDVERCRHHEAVIPAYGLPISVSGVLLSKADVFVGVDSVFLHIADLFRVFAVGLFGATDVSEWGVRFGPGQAVNADSMQGIEVGRVFDAAVSGFERRRTD